MAPFERLNFSQTASRQEQDAESSNGVFAFRLACLRSCQRLSKTLQFLRRQESLALTFWIAFDILAGIGVLVPYPPSLGKIQSGGSRCQMPCLMPGRKVILIVVSR